MAKNATYGHKRKALALKLNKKSILRVMKKLDLKPYRRRSKKLKKTKDFNKPETKHNNIIENICPTRPNIVLVTDFTYIKYQNKFLYVVSSDNNVCIYKANNRSKYCKVS